MFFFLCYKVKYVTDNIFSQKHETKDLAKLGHTIFQMFNGFYLPF